ncbi:MAG: class I SAM-dependent methyltransferase [Deltaproteobacteria bacterium]|nr:class I SAM-dependent methyltransferase [Deltaproteobacteria bacterium]
MESVNVLYVDDFVMPHEIPAQTPEEKINAYWNRYYKETPDNRVHTTPSNFCLDCVESIFPRRKSRIVDLGCGNGRDSVYLAQSGFCVTAIDQSAAALMLLTQHARNSNVTVETHQGDFSRFYTPLPTNIYSRFSLHAIDNNAQETLFRNARQMVYNGHLFAIEARTTLDFDASATTHREHWEGNHYRRYLHVPTLLGELKASGFDIYAIRQGINFAPLPGVEYPHVVRIIAR